MPPETLRDKLQALRKRHGWSDAADDDLEALLGASPLPSQPTAATWGGRPATAPEPTDGTTGADAAFSIGATVDLPGLEAGPPSEAPTRRVSLPVAETGLVGLPSRYEVLGRLGMGGMGAVWRVRDRVLGRTMALKVLHDLAMQRPMLVARFLEEAQVSAQLQHPGIVPVHDLGRLEDGRAYFTMKEVRGHTLTEVIGAVHRASTRGEWRPAADPGGPRSWSFRLLIDLFRRVCEAVAYAHARGVLHRDLKPDNIMVGAYGEVLVLDWGIARVTGHADRLADGPAPAVDPIQTRRSQSPHQRTRVGSVAGTPAYMPPEQALGELDALGPHSDVYALGCVLHEILAGEAAFRPGTPQQILRAVIDGERRAIAHDRPLPEDLAAIRDRAMALARADRYPDAAELAAEVGAWLEGAKARESALQVVDESRSLGPRIARLRAQAEATTRAAAAALRGIKPSAGVDQKLPGWRLEDEAGALEREAALLEVRRVEGLQGALTHAPTLPEAHAALVRTYMARHRDAEAARDDMAATTSAELVGRHADALPRTHAERVAAHRYLTGDGALTLVTDPPGAEVTLYRYAVHERRLVPTEPRVLGHTPIFELPLARGSYLLELRAPGRHTVRYPVHIRRCEHWSGVAPGETEPHAVHLPRLGTLGEDDVYVPAGWYRVGGDPIAFQSLPSRMLWVDAMVVDRFPVTNRRYLAFLNELIAQGDEAQALRHVPRERPGRLGEVGAIVYGRTDDGRFMLVPDADGDAWEPDYPVCLVSWRSAVAFGRWHAARTGLPWRLPDELEWQKAARGVDGRSFPWGDFLDPTFCCMNLTRDGHRLPAVVGEFPVDESPYGVRGMGGNMREWSRGVFEKGGPATPDDRVVVRPLEAEDEPSTRRLIHGGSWNNAPKVSRVSGRHDIEQALHIAFISFRLVRSFTPDPATGLGSRGPLG